MPTQIRYPIYIRSIKFFRIRLLALSNPEIEGLLQGYEKRINQLRSGMAKIAWFMRGGVTMLELLDLPQSEYKHFNEVIEENIELSKKAKQVIL